MQTLNKHRLKSFFWVIPLAIGVAVGVYPGTGGEGSQREIAGLEDKIDWWNFSTAFLYGYWPTTFDNWQFTLTILQLSCYTLGIYSFYVSLTSNRYKRLLLIPAVIGGYFVVQLWRDASLFSFSVLALSLVADFEGKSRTYKISRLGTSLALLTLSSLFKPVFAPLLFLVLFLMIHAEFRTRLLKLIAFLCILLSSLIPILLDRQLSEMAGLDKSYPEQQVFIYDISKMYCWGFSPSVIEKSKTALEPIMTSADSSEAICASLSPTGWDSLRVSSQEVSTSPALRTLSENEVSELATLRSNWIGLIVQSPMEWLLVKVSDLAQVLTMANAFHMPGIFQNPSDNFFVLLGDILLKVLLLPIQILDKFRLLSMGAGLLIGFVLLYWNKQRSGLSQNRQAIILNFLLINSLTVSLATLAFIANNGRYVMPYLLVSYLYLIWGIGSKKSLKL